MATSSSGASRDGVLEEQHELAELILRRKGDRSYDDVAKRGGLRRATIHRLATSPVRALPDPDTMIKLAAALDVSVDQVAVAALRAAGVPVTDRFTAGDVIDGLDRLTPAQRAAIEQVIRVMANPTQD
jgi:transcriptional regulator with XRE-family HTH domain